MRIFPSVFVARYTAMLCVLALPYGLGAQEVRVLKVTVLQGDGAFNDMRRHTAQDLAIQVRNESGEFVPNATVTFSGPAYGAGVMFADGSTTFVTTTDSQGRAFARGLRPNSVEGRFQLTVTASAGGEKGTLQFSQSNTLAAGKPVNGGSSKKLLIILLLAAGAGAGAAVALHGGGSSTTAAPTPTILSAGTVTVGGPR